MPAGNAQFKIESGLTVNGNSSITGDFAISGNLTVTGTTVSSGNASGDILPSPTNTYVLGTTSQRWLNGEFYQLNASGSVNATSIAVNTGGALFASSINAVSNNIGLGNTTARWDFYANNANLVSVGVLGLANLTTANISSTLSVGGLATLATINATGQSNFRAAVNAASTIDVVGAATFGNTFNAVGAVTVISNTVLMANSSQNSFVLVGNNSTSNINILVNNYTVTGNARYSNTVVFTGAANALSTLGVSGTTTLANLVAGPLSTNTTQISVIGAVSVNTGSKLAIVATGNSTVSNLDLVNDLTTVQGNVSFRSGALFVDAFNNRVGVQNTTPDAPLTITGAANISGAAVIGGNLLVQGSFTNSAAVNHNATTNYSANQHIDHAAIFIVAGNGLTGTGNIVANVTHAVLANNGILSNSSGVFAVGSNGIVVTSTGINVNSNTGIVANSSGVFNMAVGKQSMYIPVGAMTPRSSSNCGPFTTTNGAANQPDIDYMAFDGTTTKFARFQAIMPKSWNEGSITAKFAYRRASGTGAADVIWGIRGVAVANNATPVVGFGSNATVTHAASTTTANFNLTGETSACTIAGSPTAENLLFFEVFRDSDSVNDTLNAVDALLTGVMLFYTTNAFEDT